VTQVTDTSRNGVNTGRMFATRNLIKAQPELAKFEFRATIRWIDGSHNRPTIKDFQAARGEETTRSEAFQIDAGEPANPARRRHRPPTPASIRPSTCCTRSPPA
jgi:hypothetical protein